MNLDLKNDSSDDDLDFNEEEASNDLDNDIAEFESYIASAERKKSKHTNKRNYIAMRKIEQLQEERRLRKLNEDYYDDWN